MEPKTYNPDTLRILGLDTDPYRNGIDCCSIVHTSAGCYRQALNETKAITSGYSDADIIPILLEMEGYCRNILTAGYRMADNIARYYVLGMIE